MTYKIFIGSVLMVASVLWAQSMAAVRLKQGQAFEAQGQYAKALDEYRAVLVDEPNNAKAYLGAGNARYQLKGYHAALKNYQLAASKDAKLWAAYEGAATAYEALGQKEKAVAEWRRLIDTGPKEKRARALAKIESLLGKSGQTVASQASAPATSGKSESSVRAPSEKTSNPFNYDGPLFQKALSLYEAGKHQESLEYWRKVLDAQPGNPGAYYFAGVSRYNLGELDKATYNLERSTSYPDKGYNAYYYLGRIAEKQKNGAKVREYYGKYLKLTQNPQGKAEVKKRLAAYNDSAPKESAAPVVSALPSAESCALADSKRTQDSIAAALKALEPKPLNVGPEKLVTLESGKSFVFASTSEAGGASMQKALNLIQKKSFNLAIDALKAVRQDYPNTPNSAAAAYNLTGLYRYLGLGENVRILAQTALQENPPEPYRSALAYQLALGFKDQEEYPLALSVLDSVKADQELGPTAGQKLALAGEIKQKYKPSSDAAALLQQAVEAESDPLKKAELSLKWAQALLKQDNSKGAAQVYKDMLERCDKATEKHCRTAIYALGDMSYQSKNWPMAIEYYQKAMDQFADTENKPWAQYQMGNVYRQQKRYTEALKAYDKLLKEFPGSYWADQAKWNREDVIWQEKNQKVLGSK